MENNFDNTPDNNDMPKDTYSDPNAGQQYTDPVSYTHLVVIIRSHGVPKAIYDKLEEKGLDCVDATCPFVKKIHNIVAEESQKGSHIVIIGNEMCIRDRLEPHLRGN